MTKIKRKKELKPKEFLKYLLDQEETKVALDGHTFDFDDKSYSFYPEITTNEVISYEPNSNTFTVEIEEEITEDTVFKHLYEFTKGKFFHNYEDISISKRKDELSKEFWIRKDGTMTLIWKDGAMLE